MWYYTVLRYTGRFIPSYFLRWNNWKLLHPCNVNYCNVVYLNQVSSFGACQSLNLWISHHKVRIYPVIYLLSFFKQIFHAIFSLISKFILEKIVFTFALCRLILLTSGKEFDIKQKGIEHLLIIRHSAVYTKKYGFNDENKTYFEYTIFPSSSSSVFLPHWPLFYLPYWLLSKVGFPNWA